MKATIHMLQFKDVNAARMYIDNYAAGSILVTSDTNQVYVLNEAQEVIEVVNAKDNHPHVAHEQHHTNCINCGAPLTSHRCKYCDTEYRKTFY